MSKKAGPLSSVGVGCGCLGLVGMALGLLVVLGIPLGVYNSSVEAQAGGGGGAVFCASLLPLVLGLALFVLGRRPVDQ